MEDAAPSLGLIEADNQPIPDSFEPFSFLEFLRELFGRDDEGDKD